MVSKLEILIQGNEEENTVLERTTHLTIAAHHDDIEIMAFHGIEACYNKNDLFFVGCVVSNGENSPRSGKYSDLTNQEMILLRRNEQIQASIIGKYNALVLMNYPSIEIKDKNNLGLVEQIYSLLKKTNPSVVYTHNLFDKHPTHVAVALRTIEAIRLLPIDQRPKQVLGCEVWRDLDWLDDAYKVSLDVSNHLELASGLLTVFDSQISGGKDYLSGTLGRRSANATFNQANQVDHQMYTTYAIDLTKICLDSTIDIHQFIQEVMDRFQSDVFQKMDEFL